MEAINRAFQLSEEGDNVTGSYINKEKIDLKDNEVRVQVKYSSVNYKDALASEKSSRVVKSYPIIPGIDLSGVVTESKHPSFQSGDKVVATGFGLGVSRDGGYQMDAVLPGDWLVQLPKDLSLKEAMVYGTAGFTAALSIEAILEKGIKPEDGKVLVTGATGGVGSLAITMLKEKGFQVVASSGKGDEITYLKELGASEVISREDVLSDKNRMIDKSTYIAAVDPVGGNTLASILSQISYQGVVALSGLAGGTNVDTSVFPFILRGVSLVGIDSVQYPIEKRAYIWKQIETYAKNANLKTLTKEIDLTEIEEVFTKFKTEKVVGRYVVKANE